MIRQALLRRPAPQVFVSYRSQNVRIARRMADHLIASGVEVWFAEYDILLEGRDRFEDAIEEGIRRSTHGLAFTNAGYSSSKHCMSELRGLLAAHGPERVLDARLSDDGIAHREFPELRQSPHCDGRDLAAIVDLVARQTLARLRPVADSATDVPERVRGKCMGLPYYVNARGWTLERVGGQMLEDGTTTGPVLRRGNGRSAMRVNVLAGPEESPRAWRAADAEDRELYEELIRYARRHLGTLRAEPYGVHLLFHSGSSQMALTYRMRGYWTRKISVVLAHPDASQPGEFVFTFGFAAPFREYCYRAHLMDDLALSLEWGRKVVI